MAVGLACVPASAYANEPETVPLLLIVVGFDGEAEGASAPELDMPASPADDSGNPETVAAPEPEPAEDAGASDADAAEDAGASDNDAAEDAGASDNDAAADAAPSRLQVVPYDSEIDWASALFGSQDSLASYYLDMSGGAFTFSPIRETSAYGIDGNTNAPDRENDGVVHLTLHKPHGVWGLVNEDMSIAQEFGRVAPKAFSSAAPYVDFERYDANGDAILTPKELAVGICIAGYDASPYANPGRSDIPVVWPHAGKLATSDVQAVQADGMHLDSYIAIAEYLSFDEGEPVTVEREPTGIIYHELGHYLDLPDLYALNANAGSSLWGAYRVGRLSLMDNGGWAQVADVTSPTGMRYKPVALDAWSRYALGWQIPQVVTESGDYLLTSQSSQSGYTQLLIPTLDPEQYFLLENRQPTGQDEGLIAGFSNGNPRGGIVVWHIDKKAYRLYGAANEANNTTHVPAIMAMFFERSGSAFTADWQHTTPDLFQPFYDATSCAENLGDANAVIELPLYGDIETGPGDRFSSGIRLSFSSVSAEEMTVHVELPGEVVAVSSRAYELDANAARDLRMGQGALARIACNAILRETSADVSLVDAGSVFAGLPEGNVTWADAYAVLPGNANIACYDLSGAQLLELAERSLATAAPYRKLSGALAAIERLGYVDELPVAARAAADKASSSADGVLSFGGMSCDIDWNAAEGSHVRSATIAGKPLKTEELYYVAMTPSVVERYDVFDALVADTLMLWGTPADALRSYVQQPNWEP